MDERGLRLGSVAGIPILLAPSWALIAIVVTVLFQPVVAERMPEAGAVSYAVAFLFAVLLYASVLVHELGHSLVAHRFGLRVRRITLHALGGVSEITDEPPTAGKEFAVAAAGPAVSLTLGAIGAVVLSTVQPPPLLDVLLLQLTAANLLVGVFNLLPGLPLDGGRVLRSLVWGVTGESGTATRVAAGAGKVVAVVILTVPFALSGLQGSSPSLVSMIWAAMIAVFVWQGAGQAQRAAQLRQRMPALNAGALARRALAVPATLPVSEAIRRAVAAGAGGLVVVDSNDTPRGIVQEHAVRAVPEQRRPWTPIGDLARGLADGLSIPAELSGEDLLNALNAHPASEYVVTGAGGEVYGVLAAADVERALGLPAGRG